MYNITICYGYISFDKYLYDVFCVWSRTMHYLVLTRALHQHLITILILIKTPDGSICEYMYLHYFQSNSEQCTGLSFLVHPYDNLNSWQWFSDIIILLLVFEMEYTDSLFWSFRLVQHWIFEISKNTKTYWIERRSNSILRKIYFGSSNVMQCNNV